MTYEDVSDKFRQCAEYAHRPDRKTRQIVEFVKALEKASDIRPLTALYSA